MLNKSIKINQHSWMYQRGYENAAVSWSYLPDFKNETDEKNYCAGYKAGLKASENPKYWPKLA